MMPGCGICLDPGTQQRSDDDGATDKLAEDSRGGALGVFGMLGVLALLLWWREPGPVAEAEAEAKASAVESGPRDRPELPGVCGWGWGWRRCQGRCATSGGGRAGGGEGVRAA